MARTKKDIDKDLMYKMLMPSGSRTAKASQEAESPSGLSDEPRNNIAKDYLKFTEELLEKEG